MDPQGAGWGDDRGGRGAAAGGTFKITQNGDLTPPAPPLHDRLLGGDADEPKKMDPNDGISIDDYIFRPDPAGRRPARSRCRSVGMLVADGIPSSPGPFGQVPWGRGPAGAPTIRTPLLGNIEDGGLHNPTCRCWWPAALGFLCMFPLQVGCIAVIRGVKAIGSNRMAFPVSS